MAFATTHGQRIKRELEAVGVTALGMLKFGIRYLPKIIRDNEHIKAVVYGRYRIGEGSKTWKWEAGTMIATDQRVLFVDRKPGFLKEESMTYDEVSGVVSLTAWPFSALTLLTKVGNFSLRYVRMNHADRFVKYVEDRRKV